MSALVEPSELHRLSVDEYRRLAGDARVELIDGLVVDMSPRSPEHENAVDWLVDWCVAALDLTSYRFTVTRPLTIGASEPEPDLAVVDRVPPRRAHPSHARLVVEVAVTSHDRDLRTKPTVYAPYVDEYWVIDLERSVVVVHRDPVGDAYRDVTTHARGAAPAPTAVTVGPLDTSALFAAAFAEQH